MVVKDIPPEGLHLSFSSQSDSWFSKMMSEALATLHQKGDSSRAKLDLYRTGNNIDLTGDLSWEAHPTCVRCLKVYLWKMCLPVHETLAPLIEAEHLRTLGEAETELVKEDLEFTFHVGGRFDLGELLREQVILAVPMQTICNENCNGLCIKCGQDLNEGPCPCK